MESCWKREEGTHPWTAREGSRIVMDIGAHTLVVVDGNSVAGGGESRGPISNGLPGTVAAYRDGKKSEKASASMRLKQ